MFDHKIYFSGALWRPLLECGLFRVPLYECVHVCTYISHNIERTNIKKVANPMVIDKENTQMDIEIEM